MPVEQTKSLYRRTLRETVQVRRYTGTGQNRPFFDTPCRAQVVGYAPHELVGAIVQGDRKVILLAEDLVDAQFQLPIVNGDSIIVRGRPLNVLAMDDSTRREDGVLIAIVCQVRGG